ncbi:MAG: hypothetical protein F6K54_39775 [Okeania sp. SIO3B5]|uniref:hypothetical protein n=1 Tax=Okeania sp. SIO3B5 TaxID=2607811 RepID=UPI001400EE91|nr:hypothetical protein [Okeania sp. SIO3B5]NEO58650.1 hypothetical protein [Okeania sp. SIO3B5]
MANEVYTREILLDTNAQINTRKLTVKVETAKIPTARKIFIANICLVVVFLLLAIVSFYGMGFAWVIFRIAYPSHGSNLIITKFLTILGELVKYIVIIISTIFWCIVGYKWGIKWGWLSLIITIPFSYILGIISVRLMGVISAIALPSSIVSKWNPLILPSVTVFFIPLIYFIATGTIVIFGNTFGFLLKKYLEVGFSQKIAMQISGLAVALGTSVGLVLLNLSGQLNFS